MEFQKDNQAGLITNETLYKIKQEETKTKNSGTIMKANIHNELQTDWKGKESRMSLHGFYLKLLFILPRSVLK